MATSIRGRKLRLLLTLTVVLLAGLVLAHPVSTHLRAMSVLLRFSNPQTTGIKVRFAQHPVAEETFSAQTPWGPLRYRLYKPKDIENPPGIVLLHGIHDLGIEEPRLTSFARALSGAGVEIMTPELRDLADYRVTPHTVDTIGISAVILCTQLKVQKVGVTGLSFAGGLSLLAASKPEYAQRIAFVVAIGAHDDLIRVSRFFATNTVEKPDGTTAPFPAHEYGVLVLAYAHLDHFFSAEDVPIAREALRLWLHEKPEPSLSTAKQLTPQGQQMFDLILHHHDVLRPKLLEEIEAHRDEMASSSPHGQIGNLTMPVFLLHGAGDNVIPPTESQWLAHDLPPGEVRRLLISPALIHVNMDDKVTFRQEWDLVDFIAQVLDMADREKAN
ncbi:MAG: alpha/beta fold hydrolase [Acidobacteriia bacterium]|nr:alpha/beta fold hydrolase [Terriglobia bacterium]